MAEVAVGKRIRINKLQQQIMLAVLGASLAFGVCLVLVIFLTKFIIFNTKVISEKDKAIDSYYGAIKNVGICIDNNKDGKYTDNELDKCQPNEIDVADIPGTLRYNVLVNMTENNALESVARDSHSDCYDTSGNKIDFGKRYDDATTDEEREHNMYMFKVCSSLRVIPDALPASYNAEALMSSVNKIFLISGLQPDGLMPDSGGASFSNNGVSLVAIPITLTVKQPATKAQALLDNFYKSIRLFSFKSANYKWSNQLEVSATGEAYYTNQVKASETTKTVYASKEARKQASGNAALVNNTVDDVVNGGGN